MKKLGGLLLLVLAIAPETSFAHARWRLGSLTPPRTNATGLKANPCGGAARTNAPTILTPGQQITVQWEQTVNHPGYYRIAFSPANDAGFDQNVLVAVFPNVIGQQFFQTTITVPNVTCTNCTLQLIQYMTETNPPSLYFSCSDIEIRAVAGPSPTPMPSPLPSAPTNPPADDCAH